MILRHSKNAEHTYSETRERINACRRRLRRTRAAQRVLRIVQDEAVIAADALLALAPSDADLVDSEEVFEEAGAYVLRASRRERA